MYCGLENIKNIIPEPELINLTCDCINHNGVINESEVNAAIKYADEIINCALRTKYTLPLAFTPPVLEGISTDIACYRLYKRRPASIPEHIKDSYKTAVELLKMIQSDKMILDLPQEHPDKDIPVQQPLFLSNTSTKSKIFTDEMMRIYRGRP